MNRFFIFALFVLASACTSSMDLGGKIVPGSIATGGGCTQNSDCIAGDVCSNHSCVPQASDQDGGTDLDAGILDAGNSDAGDMDAGDADAGDLDAGNSDAGDLDAGNPDAGDLDAGDLDAGDSDAGGPPPSCLIDGGVFANRAYKPGDTSFCCNAVASPGSWTASLVLSASTYDVSSPYALATGDFDLDGRPDLALVSGSTTMFLYLNLGQAQFTAVSQTTTMTTGNLKVGDFNGDGRDDIAVGGPGSVGVLLNLDAGFVETDRSSSGGIVSLAVADVDGDGNLDLVGSNFTSQVSVFLGDGLGGLGPEATYATGVTQTFFIVAGFFDSDQYPDLVVNQMDGEADLLLNDGTGAFPQATSIPGVTSSYAMTVGQFVSGSRSDLVVGSQLNPQTTVFSNPADAGFSAPAGYTSVYPGGYAICDLNGDGYDDLIAMGEKQIEILINQGDGTFLPAASFPLNLDLQTLAAGDFNGDGAPDIAVVPSGATSGQIWLNGCP